MAWADPAGRYAAVLPEIKQRLASAQNILLAGHIRPDGDAIGSLLGFGLALERAGKNVQMVLTDGVPAAFRHLVGSERIRQKSVPPVDMLILLDCAELERSGAALKNLGEPDLNIDHHVTNIGYAKINLVDTQAAATAEILAQLLPALDLTIDEAAAAALLTGMITDTIGFRTTSMTSNVFRVAADLVELGADLPYLYAQALNTRSFEAVRFWGEGLSVLERQDGLVWTTLSMNARHQAAYSGRDDADLINVLSTIHDAQIVVIFVEQPGKRVKVSWRAKPGYDVASLAAGFGGGGHPAAAGADLTGSLDEVRPIILQATRRLLEHEETGAAGIPRHHPSNIEQE